MAKNFNIFYQNVNGIKTKLRDFYVNLSLSDWECIALTETWLQSNIMDYEIFDDRYVIYRKDRDLKKMGMSDGGGVILAISSSYQSERLEFLEAECVESIFVKLFINEAEFIILGLVYFRPETPLHNYVAFFNTIEEGLKDIGDCGLFLTGDFNLPILSKSFVGGDLILPKRDDFVRQQFAFFNLSQYNRVLNSNGYCLDYVLSNNATCQVSLSLLPLVPPDIHHPCLEIVLKFYKVNKKFRCTEYYDFARANGVQLYYDLSNEGWSNLYHINDVNESVEYFYNVLYKHVNANVPLVKTQKKHYKPWITPNIRADLKLKDKLLRRYKKTLKGEDYTKFKEIRSKIKKELKLSFRNFHIQKEAEIQSDPQNFWKFIKMNRNIATNAHVLIDNNNEHLVDNNKKCEAFASYFQSVYVSQPPVYDVNEIAALPIADFANVLKIDSVEKTELLEAFKKIKTKKSKGPDQLPQFFFKAYAEVLVEPLLYIFNLSLKKCIFLNKWKHALVAPIPKVPTPKRIDQHRPISLLCVPGKLFEAVLYKRIFDHIRPFLSERQFGFVPKRSTVSNLIGLAEEITDSFNDNAQLDVIYTDFRKAFDLVSFDVMLMRLREYGFAEQLIYFFHSYLNGRTQSVKYESYESDKFQINSSVPQGSNLGPLLFLILINDLPNVVKHSTSYLFADDLKISKKITNVNDCQELQADLYSIGKWAKDNKLEFNVSKCCIISYTLKKNVVKYGYELDSVTLERVNEVKDLGVLFDHKLSFDKHISMKMKEAARMLGFLMRSCVHFQNPKTLFLLYNAYIRSKLEYCNILWNPYYQVHIKQVERVQKRFLRHMYRREFEGNPYDLEYNDLLSIFEVQSLEVRRIIANLMYLFKVINNIEENRTVVQKLPFSVKTIRTRTRNLFYVAESRVNVSKFSPVKTMCYLANLYPQVDFFQHKIKTFSNILKEVITNNS